MTAESLAELKLLLDAARPLPWRQGGSTHNLVDATGYSVADFHHGHEQVTVAALANAAHVLIAAAEKKVERDDLRVENEWLREALEKIAKARVTNTNRLTVDAVGVARAALEKKS